MAKYHNILGLKINKLTVIKFLGSKNKVRIWECLCECGNHTVLCTSYILNGITKSCGCQLQESRHLKLEGKVFGELTVLYKSGLDRKQRTLWLCKCSCGNTKEIVGTYLVIGDTKSCGCIGADAIKKSVTTHGRTHTTEYNTWRAIKDRCYNTNHSSYKNYGGRGIKMSKRWFNSFELFLKDMGEKPTIKHSIERKRVNGNYTKSNCVWLEKSKQAKNTRKSRWIEHDGRKMILEDWASELGVKSWLISNRLKRGWSIRMALSNIKYKSNGESM